MTTPVNFEKRRQCQQAKNRMASKSGGEAGWHPYGQWNVVNPIISHWRNRSCGAQCAIVLIVMVATIKSVRMRKEQWSDYDGQVEHHETSEFLTWMGN